MPATTCRPGSAPSSAAPFQMGILRVQLAALDTTTGPGTEGYQDYTCRRAARLDRGTSYTLRVTTGLLAQENVRAWVDFNRDGTFDLATEQVLASTGTQHAGTFTVSPTLPTGAVLRLRIAADYVNAPLPSPCTTPQYSQTEDYRLVLTAAAAPRPVAAFSTRDSITCTGEVALQDQSRNSPTTWHWQFGDGTQSSQQHPTHRYAAAGTYTVRLRTCNASGCDSLSKPAYIVVQADGPKPPSCQPATQAYCCDFGLVRVRLAGLDHQPGGGGASYLDASCANRASLRADWTDTLRLTTGGTAAHDVRVYLDLNNDGRFDPVGELLYQGLSLRNPLVPLRLSSLTAGLTYNMPLRLRIWADYAGSAGTGPCAAPERGQVVDYSVVVLPNTLMPKPAFRLAYVQTCGPLKVALTNLSVGSTAYRWDFGDGTTSTAATPPVHTYATPGAYAIRLVATGPTYADSTQQETAAATTCPSYCVSTAWGGNEDSPLYFTRVALADMDNREERGPRVGYRDYTRYVATVRQGQTARLRAETLPFGSGGSGPWLQSLCWIDYNQDGQFGPSELTGHYMGFSPQGGDFVVPPRAKLGATRMRLVNYLVGGSIYPSNGCSPRGALAAIEDYTVLILPAQTPPRSGFLADQSRSCSGQVQFRDTTWAAPTSWRWDFGDGSTSALANPLHAYAAPGQYTISLETRNAYGSHVVTRDNYITVSAIEQGPRPPAVSLSTGLLCCANGIGEARLATLTYSGGENQPGYRDETCAQPALRLVANRSYPLLVTRGPRFAYYFVYLWLDANDNGQFEPDERLYASSTFDSDNPSKEGTFTIPTTALRNRPLRLRLVWHGIRDDDGRTTWPVPDPQTRDEEYDQVRDFTVWVDGGTLGAANTILKPDWSLYPNPSNGQVILTGLGEKQEVLVRNALGQIVLRQVLIPSQNHDSLLVMKDLPPGVYSIQLAHYSQIKRLVLE